MVSTYAAFYEVISVLHTKLNSVWHQPRHALFTSWHTHVMVTYDTSSRQRPLFCCESLWICLITHPWKVLWGSPLDFHTFCIFCTKISLTFIYILCSFFLSLWCQGISFRELVNSQSQMTRILVLPLTSSKTLTCSPIIPGLWISYYSSKGSS